MLLLEFYPSVIAAVYYNVLGQALIPRIEVDTVIEKFNNHEWKQLIIIILL